MKSDASFFLVGCAAVVCTCAPSAWVGFVDGLRGLSPEPTPEFVALEAAAELVPVETELEELPAR